MQSIGFILIVSVNPVSELKELRVLKSNLSDMSTKLDLISAKIEENSKKITDIQRQAPGTSLPVTDLNQAVSIKVNEIAEQERRQFNLCVFGLAPVDGINDIEIFLNVCQTKLNIPRTDLSDQVEAITRIGKSHENKPRPCIVRLRSKNLRHRLLRAAPNLKTFNDSNRPFPPIIIAPDLTKIQQIEKSKLNAEYKLRRDQNEDVIIRAGKIIPRPAVSGTQQAARNEPHANRNSSNQAQSSNIAT